LDEEVLKEILKSIKNKKSICPDGVTYECWKQILEKKSDQLNQMLSDAVNEGETQKNSSARLGE
jgi:hypothetical protein